MKILCIEDNADAVKLIRDHAVDNGWECQICDFDAANDVIALFDPEIIVMDWMYDADEVDKGEEIFSLIYHTRFRPIIIFSAIAETIDLPDDIRDTPLINILSKGDEEQVIKRIEQ